MWKDEALDYHASGRPGKLEIVPCKPCLTSRDLSLAYTPGVAEPCREIQRDPVLAYKYTNKGNVVAVISNGTRVLDLGNIGALASKPVMEGKGVLFKRFADIDSIDVCINVDDPEEVIRVVRALEPSFGGINLEDIRSPDCFHIERTLIDQMNIPVFHDDQHGTAIISAAAVLNGVEVAGKKIDEVKVVICGAGAAGLSCARLYIEVGVKPENLLMTDRFGVVYKGRKEEMFPEKEPFVRDTPLRTLEEALRGADVVLGVSTKDAIKPEWVKTMAPRPLIMALANPDPEITPAAAKAARPDVIMATGRSDYPNQVNNVLGFPFIFRGALDVRASKINMAMKVAAIRAIAALAKQDVPESVVKAYGGKQEFRFGPEYILPKPFDPRVLLWVPPAVAKAAMDTGVARVPIDDFDEYRRQLERRLGGGRTAMQPVMARAKRRPMRIVYPEGETARTLRAAEVVCEEQIATPILLGRADAVERLKAELNLELEGAAVIDPHAHPNRAAYVEQLFQLRARKGMTRVEAERSLANPVMFGTLMVAQGDADGLITGLTEGYASAIRPALQVLGLREGYRRAAGLYMLVLKDRTLFFADTTVNVDPSAEELADIAILAAEAAKRFGENPRIALISFSNFGGNAHPNAIKVAKATEIVKRRRPDLCVDGEMQVDTALCPEIQTDTYPFCDLKGPANVLVFATLDAANAGYKLVQRLAGAEAIGPILLGLAKPVHVLQRAASVNEIVHLTAVAVVQAQTLAPEPEAATSAHAAEPALAAVRSNEFNAS